jgi:hypothetical protein
MQPVQVLLNTPLYRRMHYESSTAFMEEDVGHGGMFFGNNPGGMHTGFCL